MSLQQIDQILAKLVKESKPYPWVMKEFAKVEELKDYELDLEILELLGLSFHLHKDNVLSLKTRTNKIKEQVFCIVDIESTGGINSGQILELNMVKDAPNLTRVLEAFRLFLNDSVFVAHNVKFDYNFISKSLYECGFGILLNRKICTIDFAQCCIQSSHYKLDALKEILKIESIHHRALNDALAAAEIFKYCLSKLPPHIKTTEELIHFTKTAKLKNKCYNKSHK